MITLYRDKLSGDIGFEVKRYTESGNEMVDLQIDHSTIRPVEVSDLDPVNKDEFIEYLLDMVQGTIDFADTVDFIIQVSIKDRTGDSHDNTSTKARQVRQ